MLFNSPIYIFCFLPFVLAGYFLLFQRKKNFVTLWLIVVSFVFYWYGHDANICLLVFSLFSNFFFGKLLLNRHKGNMMLDAILVTGLTLNILPLAFFKYSGFFIENINAITNFNIQSFDIFLPLAVSFYSFQQIAFLVDCRRAETMTDYTFVNYCCFIVFFPQLISGPIVRYEELVPQLKEKLTNFTNWNNVALGLFLFGVGLFKKTIIADTFAVWADAGFHVPDTLNFLEAWSVSLSYTFQLYFDFSGYTDMAIGVGLLFDIRLPINFNSPYQSLSIREFWQRWHISLSRWLRDYLYIPLGGNRKGNIRSIVNIFITFILGGIWHGAGWNFIIWGAMHGAALAVYRLWRILNIKIPAIICWFLTFFFINISWVFFRSSSIHDALVLLKSMVNYDAQVLISSFKEIAVTVKTAIFDIDSQSIEFVKNIFYVIIIPSIVLLSPNSMEITGYITSNRKLRLKMNVFTAFILALVFFLSFKTLAGSVYKSNFLYFEF